MGRTTHFGPSRFFLVPPCDLYPCNPRPDITHALCLLETAIFEWPRNAGGPQRPSNFHPQPPSCYPHWERWCVAWLYPQHPSSQISYIPTSFLLPQAQLALALPVPNNWVWVNTLGRRSGHRCIDTGALCPFWFQSLRRHCPWPRLELLLVPEQFFSGSLQCLHSLPLCPHQ